MAYPIGKIDLSFLFFIGYAMLFIQSARETLCHNFFGGMWKNNQKD